MPDKNVQAVFGRQLCLSLDPAQNSDFSAMVLARYEGPDASGRPIIRLLSATRQKRVAYEVQVKQFVQITRTLMLPPYSAAGVTHIIDAGGVGKPVLDYVRSSSPLTANARGISMHGGMRSWTSQQEGITRAAKLDVVSALNNAFIAKRLIYDPDMPGLAVLEDEVLKLRQTMTASGSIKIQARKGNDDVLFAAAYIAYLMGEAPAGEEAGWSQSTVGYWDAIHVAKPPAEIDSIGGEVLQREKNGLDRVRSSSYRFRWY